MVEWSGRPFTPNQSQDWDAPVRNVPDDESRVDEQELERYYYLVVFPSTHWFREREGQNEDLGVK